MAGEEAGRMQVRTAAGSEVHLQDPVREAREGENVGVEALENQPAAVAVGQDQKEGQPQAQEARRAASLIKDHQMVLSSRSMAPAQKRTKPRPKHQRLKRIQIPRLKAAAEEEQVARKGMSMIRTIRAAEEEELHTN